MASLLMFSKLLILDDRDRLNDPSNLSVTRIWEVEQGKDSFRTRVEGKEGSSKVGRCWHPSCCRNINSAVV